MAAASDAITGHPGQPDADKRPDVEPEITSRKVPVGYILDRLHCVS
jgi:hypothetical protein